MELDVLTEQDLQGALQVCQMHWKQCIAAQGVYWTAVVTQKVLNCHILQFIISSVHYAANSGKCLCLHG